MEVLGWYDGQTLLPFTFSPFCPSPLELCMRRRGIKEGLLPHCPLPISTCLSSPPPSLYWGRRHWEEEGGENENNREKGTRWRFFNHDLFPSLSSHLHRVTGLLWEEGREGENDEEKDKRRENCPPALHKEVHQRPVSPSEGKDAVLLRTSPHFASRNRLTLTPTKPHSEP